MNVNSDASRKIRVLFLEDEDLFRDLVVSVLSQKPNVTVVGAYGDGQAALAAAPQLSPDVALLDIELGKGLNGIQVGLEMRKQLPNLGVVILSNHEDPSYLTSIPRESIAGWSYLLKKSVRSSEALARAIEGSAAGFVVVDPQIVQRIKPRSEGKLARLTRRQMEIMGLIAEGVTNNGVAERLSLSVKSVENQINVIYQQLEIDRGDSALHPRVQAVLTYLQRG